jgi:hypothetical protein
MVTNEHRLQPKGTPVVPCCSRRCSTALAASLCLLIPMQAAAQQAQPSSDPGSSPVVWTLIGGGIGFGAGLMLGLQMFDDAPHAQMKILTMGLAGAAAGGVAGGRLSRRSAVPPESGANRDALWNGMLIGAASGAGVGMWWVPKTHCNVEFNPECPARLRLVVGVPAVATGAAIGALIDRAVAPRRASAGGTTTLISPVIGPGTVGLWIQRAF